MPRYEVVGIGRETGRKRVRVYDVENQEAAISAAAADGTVVEVGKIRLLPDLPPTEAQIEYAKNLNIKITKDLTKKSISQLIAQAEEEDWPTKDQTSKAKRLKIKIPSGITGDELDELIYEEEDRREELKYNKEKESIVIPKKKHKSKKFVWLAIVLIILYLIAKSKT